MKRLSSLFAAAGLLLASAAAFGQRDSNALPWKQVSLIRLHSSVAQARAVGVFARCNERIAPEECAFTVEGVRYTMGGANAAATATKFDALCIDIGFPADASPDAWNCSPVTIEGLGVSVDAGAGGSVAATGGINIGTSSDVGSQGQVNLGLGVALPMSRRLQVPMAQHTATGRPSVRLGGNVLMESNIGPVPAGQTVVFGHTAFDGNVTFLVSRPEAMTLSIGYLNDAGEAQCRQANGEQAACPPALVNALASACELTTGGPCAGTAGDSAPPTTAFSAEVDTAELRAFLDKLQPTISSVNSDLQDKLPGKMDDVFALLEADDDGEGAPALALPRLRVFRKVKEHFQNKVLPKLEEIKDTVKENVLCPS